nr:proline-rich proteoglycan 2-like [Nerophis lumbriciformis]
MLSAKQGVCAGAKVPPEPPREPNPKQQGTRDHRLHSARPASDRNPSGRPLTDAPSRGQGTGEAGDSQHPSQRETRPNAAKKTGHPAPRGPETPRSWTERLPPPHQQLGSHDPPPGEPQARSPETQVFRLYTKFHSVQTGWQVY